MIADNRLNQRNNPTANRSLYQASSSYKPIKTHVNDLNDLNILCPRCTVFKNETALAKVYMVHDKRNELFRCPNCNNVASEKQIRYAAKLELPEYIYYDKTKSIRDIKKEREESEKFIIQPINAQSPQDLLNKTTVRAVKNNPKGTRPVSTDINK